MKTNALRVRALENLIRSKPIWPTCSCRMKDGGEKKYFGMTVVEPFLNGEILSLTTNDADIAAMLRAMDETINIEMGEF